MTQKILNTEKRSPPRSRLIAAPREILVLIATILATSQLLAAEPAARADQDLRFESDILPLLKSKCARCHSGAEPKGELTLDTPANVLKGGDSGPAVVSGKPDESPIYERIHNGTMPPAKKDRLSEHEVDLVRRWIVAGARSESTSPATPKVAETSTRAAVPIVTQHDVEPILLRRCSACHGLRKQEANLDVRTRKSLLRGGKSGPAIVLGKSGDSLLMKKIRTGAMPPPQRLVEVSIKPIEKHEIELLTKWIDLGAPEVPTVADVATTAPDPLVSDKDRDFWAFQPPKSVSVPQVVHSQQVRNPIDSFVLARIEKHNFQLAFSAEADRLTLLRRATFDLTGLPPNPDEVKKFVDDPSPDAYEKLIDRLLASPRYGERWGRYWLDLAGYADSEGKREQDLPRTQAWRYRDYVIRALNADKPYNRFLLEQLAGDELANYENVKELTPELYDNLVATGFLRMAPDGTWASITGYVPDRLDVISDEIDILGSAVMGLTLKCCRCHNHKFDPLPQRDYYRLTDIFKGAYDEHDWLRPDEPREFAFLAQGAPTTRNLPVAMESEKREVAAHNSKVEAEVLRLKGEQESLAKRRANQLHLQQLGKLQREVMIELLNLVSVPAAERTETQRQLAVKYEKELRQPTRDELKQLDPQFRKDFEAFDKQIADQEQKRRPIPSIRALWDRGEPSPTYIYRRGDPQNLGKLVGPGVPSALTDGKTPFVANPPWTGAKKTGRRLAFAQWLTRPDHPLTARVAVNRLWKHHFGTGIVRTLGNFGKAGSPPSHPELLDWLAREFVQRGWSLKQMHRLMLTSAAYRQSSIVTPAVAKLDPDNRLFTRMPLVRLDAEAVYDSLLLASGQLDERRGGAPDPVQVRSDGLITPRESKKGLRRLIYIQQARKSIPTALEAFDYPQMNPNCLERRDSIVATQALYLMNDGLVHKLAEQFARRVLKEAGANPDQQIDRAFLIALSRPPTAEEREVGLRALRESPAVNPTAKQAPTDPFPRLVALCRALVNSAAFLFVD